jgi:hypothetical protein
MEKNEANKQPELPPRHHHHEHHEHDHHDHSHEHHHHHEHDHDDEERYESEGISVSRHEESLIGVFRGRLPLPYSQARESVETNMKIRAETVADQGGIIGHIKALVSAEGERCMISITDAGGAPQKRPLPGDNTGFELVAIVFGLSPEGLHHSIRSAFSEYITRLS